MILQKEVRGIFATNSYFYIDDETHCGFLIDPGAQADELLKIIEREKFTIEKILLTHGHFDHIGAIPELQARLNIEVCMQKNGRDYVENPVWNLSAYFGLDMTLDDVTYLDDFSEITLTANKNFGVKLIPLAGHTTDGAIYYRAKDSVAFVGDSIFLNSFGRTDFPGGDELTLYKNVKEKILTLPDETILLSGHSDPTTVGNEKNRPWFF
ncbi:MAG: MBL fold metallo-hydrolase [Selenomonadaceae bacterium]|nr:MBL fold metallo-hydrolase [Selenomonadaceae bacterium]